MNKFDEILNDLFKIPLHELTFEMFLQLQKIEKMYKENLDEDKILEEINKFEQIEKINIFKDKVSYTEHYKSINNLNKKILDVEKINSELYSQINEIKINHLYLENDNNKPTYGNILVYRKEQDYLYILPYKYINKSFSKILFESDEIVGWYFSINGWQNISVFNDNLYLNPSIIDDKTILGTSIMSIVSTDKYIMAVFKNSSIIPLYSQFNIDNYTIIDNNNKHKLYIYCHDKISYYIQILKYIFIEINKWNIIDNDIFILESIFKNDYSVFNNISSEELLQPLSISSTLTHYYEEDLFIWNGIKEKLLSKTEIEDTKFINLFSSSAANYLQVKLDLNEYKYDINKLLIDFPIRNGTERKLDFWINILKFIKGHETKLFNEHLIKIFNNIHFKPINGFLNLNKCYTDNYIDIWNNIILRNINNLNLKKNLDSISSYLINYNSNNINSNIKKYLNEIIISLYSTKNFISLIININNLLRQLDLHVSSDFYDEILFLFKSQIPNYKKIKEMLFYFVNNEYILTTILSLDFESLFIYGIINILKEYGNYEGINSKINNNNIIWDDNGFILKTDFKIEENGVLEVNTDGNLLGYGKLNINNNLIQSHTNLYISNIDEDFPEIFSFMYNHKGKKLYFRQNIYNTIIQNIEVNNHFISKIQQDKKNNNYYLIINVFLPGKPIKINDNSLYTYTGEEFMLNNNEMYYNNLIKIQSKHFINRSKNIFNN